MDNFDISAESASELTLRDYLRILFKYQWQICVFFCTVVGTVFIGLQFRTPVYEATVKMLVTGTQRGGAVYYKDMDSGSRKEISATRSEIVRSLPVIKLAVETLRLDERPDDYERPFASPLRKAWINLRMPGAKASRTEGGSDGDDGRRFLRAVNRLGSRVRVEPIRDTSMFTIMVTDFDPNAAAVTANVVSRAYVIFDLEQQMSELRLKYGVKHPTIRQISDHIQYMKANLTRPLLDDAEAMGPASVKIVQQALAPLSPSGSSKKITLAMSVFMSLFLGVMFAFFLDYMDQTVRFPRELAALLGAPVLGSLPRTRRTRENADGAGLAGSSDPRYCDFLMKLSGQLNAVLKKNGARTVLFVSPDRKEGVTTALTELGACLADRPGVKVLLVEANVEAPALQKIFKLKDGPGLIDVLTGKERAAEAVRQISPSLDVLPLGDQAQFFAGHWGDSRLRCVLDELKGTYDVILLDGASLKHGQTAEIFEQVDGVVLLAAEGQTRRHVIAALLEPLRRQPGVRIFGGILGMRRFVIPEWVYRRV